MTPDFLFQVANMVALASWLGLGLAVIFRWTGFRDAVAGAAVPVAFAVLYSILILAFWAKTDGGFDSLANVQKLFTAPWAALAGWVHYLAFDLFMGAHIAKRMTDEGLPRLLLLGLLPLTFLFGPIGYLGFTIVRIAFRKVPA